MKKIKYILVLAFVLRALATIFVADLNKDYYWEYGEIAKNLVNGNGFSLFHINDGRLDEHYLPENTAAKSAYMPPGYVFTLVPFIIIDNVVLRNILLILFQIVLSLLSIYLLYKLTRELFNEQAALISAISAAILPEFIYAIFSFTPVVIYHVLILVLLHFLLIRNLNSFKHALLCGLLITLIIYFRNEFILFGILLVLLLFIQKHFKFSFIAAITIILLLLPWGIRNYYTFNQIIPFSTSFGLNLYRGNNPHEIGAWGDEGTNKK